MVRCSMMPVATSSPGAPAQRPKVPFSIESLVGDSADNARAPSPQSATTDLQPASAAVPAAAALSPGRRSPAISPARSPPPSRQPPAAVVSPAADCVDTAAAPDVLQQRLAQETAERALQERLLRVHAHGLAAGAGALPAFPGLTPFGGVPPSLAARLPLADPRYTLKLAQLRGELLRPPGLLPPAAALHAAAEQPAPAPSEMPLYPWLMSRHGRVFPGRFAPGPHLPEFLFQPFRKPKRIRTAFSPSQLLKLEHAFENNHYVVGQERKQLAQSLSLSETQVKVWFQNRRTKHKRAAPEGDGGDGGACADADADGGAACDGSDDSAGEDGAGVDRIDVTN